MWDLIVPTWLQCKTVNENIYIIYHCSLFNIYFCWHLSFYLVIYNFGFVCFDVKYFLLTKLKKKKSISIIRAYEKLAMACNFRQPLVLARQWPSQGLAVVQQFEKEKLKN
jgi:hypothetical protein